MNVASTALVRLNLETRVHHPDADAGWRSLVVAPSKHAYIRQLVSTYGFEAPLEAALAYTPGLRDVVDLRARSRAGLIAQDLMTLGLTPAEVARLPYCFPIAPFSTAVEALGWMYVAERATLVHTEVRVHLGSRVPEVTGALSYVDAYRDGVGERWNEFGRVLDRVAPADRDHHRLVAATHCGFRCLLDWQRTEYDFVALGA